MKLSTHLNFPGNCAGAFHYYEQNLGGKILMLMKQSQAPGASPKSGGEDPVLHARIQIGETLLVGNDVPPNHFQPMRSVYLALQVDNTPEAERLYKLLTDGGEIFMPMAETFFAFRFSMLRDRFGTSWMILHARPAPPSA